MFEENKLDANFSSNISKWKIGRTMEISLRCILKNEMWHYFLHMKP